jgi:ferritin
MPGIAMKPKVVAEFQRQLNYELGAAQNYLAMALWCDSMTLKGFARFFHKQVEEEREHAGKLMNHLLDRGVLPELTALEARKAGYRTLLEVVQHAQKMESSNTLGINQAYEAALAAKDYPAQVCLQWFINEQVEEEAWTDELVDRVQKATCAGSCADLDRHIERYLSEGKKEA